MEMGDGVRVVKARGWRVEYDSVRKGTIGYGMVGKGVSEGMKAREWEEDKGRRERGWG